MLYYDMVWRSVGALVLNIKEELQRGTSAQLLA